MRFPRSCAVQMFPDIGHLYGTFVVISVEETLFKFFKSLVELPLKFPGPSYLTDDFKHKQFNFTILFV